jgi:chromate transporter
VAPEVRVWALLRVWIAIGLQSFGGGASTQLLIRQEFVDRRHWIGADELLHMWSLCLFTPGINLVSLTVLIGRRLCGARGVAASLAGLLLPSGIVTCLLTAGFSTVQQSAAIHAVLRGVIPATAGIMLVVGMGFAKPLIDRARSEGRYAEAATGVLILASALSLVFLKLPVFVVVLGGGLLGVVLFAARQGATSIAAGKDGTAAT